MNVDNFWNATPAEPPAPATREKRMHQSFIIYLFILNSDTPTGATGV